MPRYYDRVKSYIKPGDRICVLGLAYKALSHIVEKSAGVALCNVLAMRGHIVKAHDNLAVAEASRVVNEEVTLTNCLNTALEAADVVFITTFDEDYISLDVSSLPDGCTVVDFWRALPHLADASDINYVPMGRVQPTASSKKLFALWDA